MYTLSTTLAPFAPGFRILVGRCVSTKTKATKPKESRKRKSKKPIVVPEEEDEITINLGITEDLQNILEVVPDSEQQGIGNYFTVSDHSGYS
jgi:hypothetical protein